MATRMPGARWFPEARLNYAENLLQKRDDGEALVFWGEDKVRRRLSRAELYAEVARFQQFLIAAGVGEGDRVAGYLPNLPETLIAMLAADRARCHLVVGLAGFRRTGRARPLRPDRAQGADLRRWLLVQRQAGRLPGEERRSGRADAVAAQDGGGALPGCRVRTSATSPTPSAGTTLAAGRPAQRGHFQARRLRSSAVHHVLFSGTTGVPKCIVHCHGGVLLQHLKEHQLHSDVRPGDRLFYFTTCGWMMWNWLVSGLACGATLLLYDGSPFAAHGHGALRLRRGRKDDPLRHLGQVHRRRRQARPDAGQDARSVGPARHVLDRQPAVAGRLRLGLSRNQAGHPARLDFRRHRHRFLLRPRQPGAAGLSRRNPVSRAGHGGRCVRR